MRLLGPKPAGPFPTLVADPPWMFGDRGSRIAPKYPVMPLGDIKALGPLVVELVTDSALLFLWAPNSFVVDGQAQEVARAWGFEPKQLIPWFKTTADGRPKIGMGHYTRVCTEMLLLCRRGRVHVEDRGVPGIIVAERRAHSEKPDESYRLIERLHRGPYLEMFARRQYAPHWKTYGNEAPLQ